MIDNNDDDKEKEAGKKKKAVVGQRVKVKVQLVCLALESVLNACQITGRKENAEEAKRRIIGQADKLVSTISHNAISS